MVDLDAQHCNTAATKKKQEEQEVYNTNVSSPVLAGLIFFFLIVGRGSIFMTGRWIGGWGTVLIHEIVSYGVGGRSSLWK